MQIAAPNQDNSQMKMYVLVNREKLTLVQCAVQSTHSVHSYCCENANNPALKEWNDNHKTLILLEANEFQIKEAMTKFNRSCTPFYEPDLGNLLTACAFEPLDSITGKVIFGEFSLLK